MGIYPKPVLDVFSASVDQLVVRYQEARADAPPVAPARRLAAAAE
jgi:hypothetical protein